MAWGWPACHSRRAMSRKRWPWRLQVTIKLARMPCTSAPCRVLLQPPTDRPMQSVAYSPDGACLAGMGPSGLHRDDLRKVTTWDARSGRVLLNIEIKGGWWGPDSVAFSPD